QGALACSTQPLAKLTLLSADYQDLDGDHDAFPDTGETGRVVVRLRNDGPSLTGVVLTLTSTDPNVACITQPVVPVGNIPAGATVAVGGRAPAQPGFTFTASNALQFQPFPNYATINLRLDVAAHESLGTTSPITFSFFADISVMPPGAQVPVLGPDGIAGTVD